MSSVFGAKESFLASTRMQDTPPPEKPKQRFRVIEWLLNLIFPASALNLGNVGKVKER